MFQRKQLTPANEFYTDIKLYVDFFGYCVVTVTETTIMFGVDYDNKNLHLYANANAYYYTKAPAFGENDDLSDIERV
jgi:hypothetical protein